MEGFKRGTRMLLKAAMTMFVAVTVMMMVKVSAYAAGPYNSIQLQVPYFCQREYGDCGISSISMIEAYHTGKGVSDFISIYSAVYSANGNSYYINSACSNGKYVDITISLESFYEQLKNNKPILIRREPYEHWSVITGYNGSTSNLETSGFVVWNTATGLSECKWNEVNTGRKFDLATWLKAPNWNGSKYVNQGNASLVRAKVRGTGIISSGPPADGTHFTYCEAENITTTTAKLSATLDATYKASEVGFYLGKSSSNMAKNPETPSASGVKYIWYDLGTGEWTGDLEPNTTYYYQIYFVTGGVTYKSTVKSFKTKSTDTTKPVISNAKVTNVTTEGYRVSCTVTDNVGVTKVQFPTWTENNGQDDLAWHNAVKSGDTYYYDVKISEHNNERGKYLTDIYAWDAAGNSSMSGVRPSVPNPSYKISYVLNGGTNSKSNPTSYTYGKGVTQFANPTKSGYSFGGWYSDSKFTKKVTSISASSTGDITLYAKWTTKKKIQNTITAKDITITAKTKAQTVNLNASALGGAKLSYSGKKATVNSKGVATVPANYVGCLLIKVTSAATSDYLQTTKDVRIYVQPLAPTLKKVTSNYKKTIYVNWSTVKICDGYEVWYSTRQDLKNAKCVVVKGNNKKSVEFKKTSGKTYYIRVRAYKKVNGNKNYSAYSNRKKVNVK